MSFSDFTKRFIHLIIKFNVSKNVCNFEDIYSDHLEGCKVAYYIHINHDSC